MLKCTVYVYKNFDERDIGFAIVPFSFRYIENMGISCTYMEHTRSTNSVCNNVLMRVTLTVTTCWRSYHWMGKQAEIDILRVCWDVRGSSHTTKGTACRDRPTLNCAIETFIAFRKIDNLERRGASPGERKRENSCMRAPRKLLCKMARAPVFLSSYAKKFRRNYKLHLNCCIMERAQASL